jgi:hypothetical protein
MMSACNIPLRDLWEDANNKSQDEVEIDYASFEIAEISDVAEWKSVEEEKLAERVEIPENSSLRVRMIVSLLERVDVSELVQPLQKMYAVKLFLQGSWRRVVVDDKIPFQENGVVALPLSNKLEYSILIKAILIVAKEQSSFGTNDQDLIVDTMLVLRWLTGKTMYLSDNNNTNDDDAECLSVFSNNRPGIERGTVCTVRNGKIISSEKGIQYWRDTLRGMILSSLSKGDDQVEHVTETSKIEDDQTKEEVKEDEELLLPENSSLIEILRSVLTSRLEILAGLCPNAVEMFKENTESLSSRMTWNEFLECCTPSTDPKDDVVCKVIRVHSTSTKSLKFEWHQGEENKTTTDLLLCVQCNQDDSEDKENAEILLTLESDLTSNSNIFASILVHREDDVSNELILCRDVEEKGKELEEKQLTMECGDEVDTKEEETVEEKQLIMECVDQADTKEEEKVEEKQLTIECEEEDQEAEEHGTLSPLPRFGQTHTKQRKSLYDNVIEPVPSEKPSTSWEGVLKVRGEMFDVVVSEMPCSTVNQVHVSCVSKTRPERQYEGTIRTCGNKKNHAYGTNKSASCYYEDLAVRYCTSRLPLPNAFLKTSTSNISNRCSSGRLAQSTICANIPGTNFYRIVVDVPFGGTLSVCGKNIVAMGMVPQVLAASKKFNLVRYDGEISPNNDEEQITQIFSATHLNTKGQGNHVCAELHVHDAEVRQRTRLVLFDLETRTFTELSGLAVSLRYLVPREAGYLLLGVISGRANTSKWTAEIASSSGMTCTPLKAQNLFLGRGSYIPNRDSICFRAKIDMKSYENLGFRVSMSDLNLSLDVSVIQCKKSDSPLKLPTETVLGTFRGKGSVFLPSVSCLVKNLNEDEYVVMQARVLTNKKSSIPFYRVASNASSLSDKEKEEKEEEEEEEVSWCTQIFVMESENKNIEDDVDKDSTTKKNNKKKKKKKGDKKCGNDVTDSVFSHDTTTIDVYRSISKTWPTRWADSKLRNKALEETEKRVHSFGDGEDCAALRPKVTNPLSFKKQRLVPSFTSLSTTCNIQRVLNEDVFEKSKSRFEDTQKQLEALQIERSKLSDSIEAWNRGSLKSAS